MQHRSATSSLSRRQARAQTLYSVAPPLYQTTHGSNTVYGPCVQTNLNPLESALDALTHYPQYILHKLLIRPMASPLIHHKLTQDEHPTARAEQFVYRIAYTYFDLFFALQFARVSVLKVSTRRVAVLCTAMCTDVPKVLEDP